MPRRASVKLWRWAWPGGGEVCPPRRMVWEWVRWGVGRASREERLEEEVGREGSESMVTRCDVMGVVFVWRKRR